MENNNFNIENNNDNNNIEINHSHIQNENNIDVNQPSLNQVENQNSSINLNESVKNSELNMSAEEKDMFSNGSMISSCERLRVSKMNSSVGSFNEDKLKQFDEENGGEIVKEGKLKEMDIISCEDDENFGWRGIKTLRIVAERYLFGIVVAAVVGFFIIILSLPKWSDENNYLNDKTYSIFFIISSIFFGPMYVICGFIASYGVKKVKDARIIIYGSSIAISFIIIFALFTVYKVKFWFYYLDVISVLILFAFGEVIFSFRISSVIQKVESGVVSKIKSAITAYNYAAPDIIVTVFSLVYMFFLIPVYLSIDNSIFRLGWRLVIHPIYWTIIVMIARQFLDRDISTSDIMLNTNIVLHTFFHHQTLGKVFVFTFDDSGNTQLTYIGICISAMEDILLRAIALKRDEWFFTLLYDRQRAIKQVYSQESLQLRAAILNIQTALDFSGLITAPLFVYMFEKHKLVFHVLDGSPIVPITLFIQSLLSILLDFIVEISCTYIETKYYKLPIKNTWEWMKSHKFSFMTWLIYGSVTMGLFAMIWLMVMVPRSGICSTDHICSCKSIFSNAVPDWCYNSTSTM